MSGKQHATGQPPQQTHSERSKPNRWFRTKQPTVLADQTRTKRYRLIDLAAGRASDLPHLEP
jgi:hypothetical protein